MTHLSGILSEASKLPSFQASKLPSFQAAKLPSFQAAEAFVREATSAFALIASSPVVWPRFEAGTRRYVLRKFPYDIIYREISGGIEVVAVAHHKRRPRYWRRRMPPSPGN